MLTANTQHQIPMLPTSVVAMLGIVPHDPAYFERVVEIVRRDPALATMALHFANSSAFSGQVASATLDQAIVRLGARRFVNMVTSSHLVQVFVPASEEMSRLWRHATSASVAARSLARLWPKLAIHPDWAAVAGLVHNLGAMSAW